MLQVHRPQLVLVWLESLVFSALDTRKARWELKTRQPIALLNDLPWIVVACCWLQTLEPG
jgi:hypothetical protein